MPVACQVEDKTAYIMNSVLDSRRHSANCRKPGEQYCHRHLSSNGVMDARGDDDDTELNCEEDDGGRRGGILTTGVSG